MRPTKWVLVLGLLLAGCGGGGDEGGGSPEATVDAARSALLDGDGPRACEQFTDDARRSLAGVLSAWTGGSRLTRCEDVARSVERLVSPFDRRRIEGMELRMEAGGQDRAVVRVVGDASIPGAGLAVRLERREGRWRIAGWE